MPVYLIDAHARVFSASFTCAGFFIDRNRTLSRTIPARLRGKDHSGNDLSTRHQQEQIAAIEDWRNSTLFSQAQRAALAYTDAMTIDVQVPDAVQEELQRHFSERQIIELTVLIGTYNMHTRVFQALEIERRSAIDKGEPSSETS